MSYTNFADLLILRLRNCERVGRVILAAAFLLLLVVMIEQHKYI